MTLLEHHIRPAVEELCFELDPAGEVVHEKKIAWGTIADTLLFGEHLWGFEIKSDGDTLERLNRQMYGYSSICDFCAVVCTDTHSERVFDQSRYRLGDWWGVYLAQANEGEVELLELRSCRLNPIVMDGDCSLLREMKWLRGLLIEEQEVAEACGKLGWKYSRRLSRPRLIQSLSLKQVQKMVSYFVARRECFGRDCPWLSGPSNPAPFTGDFWSAAEVPAASLGPR